MTPWTIALANLQHQPTELTPPHRPRSEKVEKDKQTLLTLLQRNAGRELSTIGLADATGMSPNIAANALRMLEELGHVKSRLTKRGGGRAVTRWWQIAGGHHAHH